MAVNFKKTCKALFGEYVEASEDPAITNDRSPRTHTCLVLGPANNLQGSTKCLDLETGQLVKRRVIKVLPMPGRVIRAVNALGKKKNIKKQPTRDLEFRNRHHKKFEWENEELQLGKKKVTFPEPPIHPEIGIV